MTTRCAVRSLALPLLVLTLVGGDEALIDLRASAPVVDGANLRLHAVIAGLAGGRDATITIERCAGVWRAGTASAAGFQAGSASADSADRGLTFAEGRLRGRLTVVLEPVPAKKGEAATAKIDTTFDLDVTSAALTRVHGDEVPPDTANRFWHNVPEPQGAVARVQGTATAAGGQPLQLAGHLAPPERAGYWNMGTRDGDGLRLRFDLGSTRQNWNHARLAVHTFATTRALPAGGALRVRLTTDRPRADAQVTLWLREEDGSWYYLRSALPLVDAVNEALLPLDAFVEAEWVAPGSHLDEDYTLDLGALSQFAIGVVDPFGIGEVSFTVQSIALVAPTAAAPAPAPAEITVSGRTLSVNGHELVPPGIFGGFAESLPQQHRPGSQRFLYAGAYPRMPRHAHVAISPADLREPGAVARLITGAMPERAALAAHFASALADLAKTTPAGQRQVVPTTTSLGAALTAAKALLGQGPPPALAETPKGEKRPDDPFKTLRALVQAEAAALNALLDRRDLYDATVWAGIAVPVGVDVTRDPLTLSDTVLRERNRQLLEAAVGAALAAPVPRRPHEAFYVDCYGERKEPAQILRDDQWREHLADYGRRYAAICKREDYHGIFEFWNEPYLNWAERSRSNYGLSMYRADLAATGAPVRIKRKDGSTRDEDIVPHLAWRQLPSGEWQVYDPTAFSYWSGRGNGWLYDRMFGVVATAMKQAWPEMLVSAGWGFRWNEDHWAAWDLLYKPTLDRNPTLIDCVHEHHYQGDTAAMNASYEVLAAYSVTAHGKWRWAINTETNDLVDAPARGRVETSEKAERATHYRQMCYNLRDLINCVQESPDKLKARAMIHHQRMGEAPAIVFACTRHLRGRLLAVERSDPDVWCAAAIDGTDPALPTVADGPLVSVVLWNDHRDPRSVRLHLAPPAGCTFTGTASVLRTTMDWSNVRVGMTREERELPSRGGDITVTLDSRSAYCLNIRVAGTLPTSAELVRRQFFSPDILTKVSRGGRLDTRIAIDPQALAGARRAWLRLVVEEVSPGEAWIEVAGKKLPIPAARTADNVCAIREIPIALADLAATTAISVVVDGGNHAGIRLCMASVMLESGP